MKKYSLQFIEKLDTKYNKKASDWSGAEYWESLDSLSALTFETSDLTVDLLAELINNQGLFPTTLSNDDFDFSNSEIGCLSYIEQGTELLSEIFFAIKPVTENLNLENLFG